jgi:opacity protein-like surface antigen
MRRTLPCLLLSLAISSASIVPAVAGGDINPDYATGISPYATGIGPYGVATPVPAPIPIPYEEAAWYFRADFAAGFGSQPSVSTAGLPFGSGNAAHTIGLNSAWRSDSFEPAFTGGVGVGYVWGPRFRTDLTVDIHSIMNTNFNGSQTYSDGAATQTVTIQDKTKFMSTILLMNGYYDIRTGTAFTPYIGGGVGFAVDQLTQEASATYTGGTASASNSGRSTHIAFAGAAMAGLTYDINTFVSLDVGYRYLYIGGSNVDIVVNNTNSKISIGGINEHQIRVGLRFYVN